ncbi:MAG: PAS domain S-box protein [Acidobacteria bacterium]|nr:PAS domain S-box protein [Acidobacteriota bacterium]
MHKLAPQGAPRPSDAAADTQPASFRELAEHSRGVVWVRGSLDGELRYLNPAFERVWGHPRNDAQLNTGWIEPIHADDQVRVLDALRPAALRQGFREEYRIVHHGETRWVHDRGVAVADPDGVVRRIIGIAEDITERRALEQQLVGSQKLEGMGRLAGGIAHDFNNLLTAILGYSESIVRQSDPNDPLRAEAREIQRAGEKAAPLTRQLLAFGKRQALKMTVVDLNVIVRDVHQLMKRLIGEHITMDLQLSDALDAVTADRVHSWNRSW